MTGYPGIIARRKEREQADEALYECKNRDHNSVYVYQTNNDGEANLVLANLTDFPSNLH